jgi:hypothetical protein
MKERWTILLTFPGGKDRQRLNEEALNRWHQQLEGLTLCH